ncbi:Rho GTPase activation protein [Xylariaceae sp. AK1471]|nr:Rho GTPase activation protein [Xylariaceae sp. AK1471]
MADPLSVAASIVGLIATGAKISQVLASIVSRARHASRDCQNLQFEVESIQAILSQLQLFLLGTRRAPRSRTSLILVNQVITTLATCVTTFSELDTFTEALKSESDLNILDRLRWVAKESEIKGILARLESHKSSLNLMLTILTCQRQEDAEDKVDRLCELVQKALESNTVLAQRLANLETTQIQMSEQVVVRAVTLGSLRASENMSRDLTTPRDEADNSNNPINTTWRRDKRGFAFEELLMNSRAYRKASLDSSDTFSVVSSAGRTGSWSMLSGLSLSETSNIAILGIPIYETELSNKEAYNFSPPAVEPAELILDEELRAHSAREKISRRQWLRGLVRANRSQPLGPRLGVEDNSHIGQLPTIFSAPLQQSITYANIAISLLDQDGETYVYGFIPIVVGKLGVRLKQKATDSQDIFARNGNPSRMMQLQTLFDSPPQYGKGVVWFAYTEYDAAALLLRYLKTLPEPVVPYAMYDKFVTALTATSEDATESRALFPDADREKTDELVSKMQQLMREMPPLNRQLLLYLLDLLAVFAAKSNVNGMTAARLTACFQPAILSSPPPNMNAEAHRLAAEIVVFLIEKQDYGLIGLDL